MLKRWRIMFYLTQDYFKFCHLWVLLPSLPLQLWNVKALESIGNVLDHFIKVDDLSLNAPERHLGKILVEVDTHLGLLESLEIDWRGHIVSQIIDYLGIHFRCSTCRRMRHLRRNCLGAMEEEEFEDSML